jgi:hypothetical protein
MMKHLILSSLMIVVLFVSCEKEDNTPPPPPAKYVGQGYQGGIIFYVDASGQHGLIYAPTDLGQAPWGCYGTLLPGADNGLYGSNVVASPGEGAQNTIDIMNGCSQAGIAARLCGDLVYEGYSDWFLPGKKELNMLYTSGLSIVGDVYWSSTQDGSSQACHQDFSSGEQYKSYKSQSNSVIAVRSF